MNDSERIEAYLASLAPEKRAVLDDWQQRIKALAPDAVEVFSYGMPMFKWRGKGFAAFAAGKSHFGYYPVSSKTIASLGEALSGYKRSRGAVQFTFAKPLTDALLRQLIESRLREIESST